MRLKDDQGVSIGLKSKISYKWFQKVSKMIHFQVNTTHRVEIWGC